MPTYTMAVLFNALCRHFLREVYDGQIFVKLKKGMHFPGLDLWVRILDSLPCDLNCL
jgi:hypothetical protein